MKKLLSVMLSVVVLFCAGISAVAASDTSSAIKPAVDAYIVDADGTQQKVDADVTITKVNTTNRLFAFDGNHTDSLYAITVKSATKHKSGVKAADQFDVSTNITIYYVDHGIGHATATRIERLSANGGWDYNSRECLLTQKKVRFQGSYKTVRSDTFDYDFDDDQKYYKQSVTTSAYVEGQGSGKDEPREKLVLTVKA